MRIAIYYPWIRLKSGVERTILQMASGSKNSITLFTNFLDKKSTFPEFKDIRIVKLKKVSVKNSLFAKIYSAFIIALQKVDLSGYDMLVVHTEGISDLFVLRNNTVPTVAFCHTPFRPVFSPYHRKEISKKLSGYEKFIVNRISGVFIMLDKYLWKKYRYIIFNSNVSLKRSEKAGLLSRGSRYSIVHPGIDFSKIKPSGIFKPYFLLPGRIAYSKNIELGINAFLEFEKRYPKKRFKLIVSGQIEKKAFKYLQRLKKTSATSGNITFIANPDEKKYKKLYSECYAVLATAINEDWGLTALEANGYGKPAICVKSGGFKESQISGRTGFLVKPEAGPVADKLVKIAKDPKLNRKMGRSARIHSLKFSSRAFSDNINKVFTTLN
jgi:glycosyltransferase involved in cell wall biosynthesis